MLSETFSSSAIAVAISRGSFPSPLCRERERERRTSSARNGAIKENPDTFYPLLLFLLLPNAFGATEFAPNIIFPSFHELPFSLELFQQFCHETMGEIKNVQLWGFFFFSTVKYIRKKLLYFCALSLACKEVIITSLETRSKEGRKRPTEKRVEKRG